MSELAQLKGDLGEHATEAGKEDLITDLKELASEASDIGE